MIELPEAITLAEQLKGTIMGKTVKAVLPPTYLHKFAWFHGGADTYHERMKGQEITDARAFGIYVEIGVGPECKLDFNDGVAVRYHGNTDEKPGKYQLLIEFTDGSFLVFMVAMYGGFVCHGGEFDNKYYLASKNSLSPLTDAFDTHYFEGLLASVKGTMSAKAFLATEQRIPGLGNGVLQDILLVARIHPKRKLESLTAEDKKAMFRAVKEVLADMGNAGGRDTEKDLYGNYGRYRTRFSKNTYRGGCPICGGVIEKQAFLGGTVYTCAHCQPLGSSV